MRPIIVLPALLFATVGIGQGRAPAAQESHYLNFEAPQVRPIIAPRINGIDFVFVCNTPDNSVEVYRADLIETDAVDHGFVARIPVGPEPVTVLWRPVTATSGWIYTANWLGDSVTAVSVTGVSPFSYQIRRVIDLSAQDLLPGGFAGNRHDQNQQFGHRPLGLALLDATSAHRALLVCKETASSVAWLDLDFVDGLPGASLDLDTKVNGVPVDDTGSGGANVLLTDKGPMPFVNSLETALGGAGLNVQSVMKEPRVVAVRPGTTEVWFLGHKGGGSRATRPPELPSYDFDLLAYDVSTQVARPVVTGLGTTNFDMVFKPDGSRLYVVGQEAQADLDQNPALSGAVHGFVRTMLYRIDLTGAVPIVARRDLNAVTGSPTQAVAKSSALAQVTGIDYYGGFAGKQQVVVTAHGSDRVAVVEVNDAVGPDNWVVKRVNVPEVTSGEFVSGPTPARNEEDLVGPRAVAVRDVPASVTADRAYVLNRLRNTVTVVQVSSSTGTLALHKKTFKMRSDPVPAYIRDGQRFLYNAHFSSSGFVSCASCHVDARLDQQQWRLGPAGHFTAPDPFEIGEAAGQTPKAQVEAVQADYPTDKNGLTTQSLQGLVNFEVARNDVPTGVTRATTSGPLGLTAFDLLSNAPYHWRGDKPTFLDFNEAFFNLMGFSEAGAAAGDGLQAAKMQLFETFIRSVHYPPNPMQQRSRVLSGSLGTPTNVDDGNGALRGLKVFHQLALNEFGGRSCVQCHFLPEGSNNRVTTLPASAYAGDGRQPMDTPTLRDLRAKEARLELTTLLKSPASMPTPASGDFGLSHEGFLLVGPVGAREVRALSSNHFVEDVDALDDPAGLIGTENRGRALLAFMREFDHGVAPMVGRSVALLRTTAGFAPATGANDVLAMEGEFAKANCGVAVLIDNGGVRSSFWLSAVAGTTKTYRNAASGATILKSQLVALVDIGGTVVFTATPLGDELRYATLDLGPPAPPATSGTPTATLAGTRPNAAYASVPQMTGNWDRPFWVGRLASPGLPQGAPAPFPRSIDSLQILQANVPGLAAVKHDAPRRLRVAGQGLVEGAVLEFGMPMSFDPVGPSWTWETVDLPIFRTSEAAGASVIWETAVEFDPLNLYILLAGGPNAPGVVQALEGKTPVESGVAFDTANWNRYRIRVRNPDGALTAFVEAPLAR